MKKGFTLPEVLITLGIIGVVAALTIPTLIANINGLRNRTQFKKAISTLHQAVRMNKVEYEYDFSNTDCSSYCRKSECYDNFVFNDIFEKNLKGLSCYTDEKDYLSDRYSYSGKTISSLEFITYTLADGTVFAYVEEGGGACSKSVNETLNDFVQNNYDMCTGIIDVNGPAAPNKEVECSNTDTE